MFLSLDVSAQNLLQSDSIQYYIKRAEIYLEEYQYEKALEKATYAYKRAKYNNDDKSTAKIHNVLAQIYELNRQENEAIINYHKALTFASSSKSYSLKAKLLNNLGNLYIKTDSTVAKGKNNYLQAFDVAKEINDTIKMIEPLLNLAEYYINNNNHKIGYKHLTTSRALLGSNLNILNLQKTKLNNLLGQYFLHVKKYERADEYIAEAISSASSETINLDNNKRKISRYHKELATSYYTKYKIHKNQKEFELANPFLEKHFENLSKSNDLIREIELQRATIEFNVDQMKDKVEQANEKDAENFSKEIKWQIIFILGTVLILISLAFLISSYKNNLQKKKLNNDLIGKNKELVNAKETAEQVSTLKSQFISTVSHELRTPLYGVIGLTSLLMENPEEKRKKEYLESLKFFWRLLTCSY